MEATHGRTGPAPKVLRSFTATARDLEMLEAVARYHGFSRSATLMALVKKEFWRLFPAGTGNIKPDRGARIQARPSARS